MELCCNLEVDVNGEEIFMVNKQILASFSGRFRKLFSRLNGSISNLKVIFHDFPGGAEGFELIGRFCYSRGKTEITAANIILLSCAARFMEMGADGCGNPNLIAQIEKPLEEINYWTWSELLVALKQCQDLLPTTDSLFILEKVLSCLVERIALSVAASPHTSFSDSSTFHFSYDTRSTDSMMNICCQRSWWFKDLMFFNVDLIDKVIKMMIMQKFEHDLICRFLLYYRKSRFHYASPAEKCNITEVVINLLSSLDRSSPCKSLFNIFRVALSLKISKIYRKKLESLIGSQLDQATLDYLLVPSPRGKDYAYDVSLVLRLVKVFLFENSSWLSMSRLNKVSGLMDSYLAEVSPDSHLKPSKFAALLKLLPDFTRQSHDGLYLAMDTYFEVHAGLCEEEKLRICSALNYEKLSADALKHLALNSKFPSTKAVKYFINQQSNIKSLHPSTFRIITLSNSQDAMVYMGEKADAGKVPQYAKMYNLTTTEKFEAQFQGMQRRVMELEKICSIMQTDMCNAKRRLSCRGNAKYLPKFCS